MKFVFTDSRHNLFHWLTVVLISVFNLLILTPSSAYMGLIGFLLSRETIQPFFSAIWLEKISYYFSLLPYFPTIKFFLFTWLGHWYVDAPTWWTMVIGIPLIILGIDILLINLFNLFYSVFSLKYNRTHCPFCKQPIKFKTD